MRRLAGILIFVFILSLGSQYQQADAQQPISFSASGLVGETVNQPTSIQFGPDDRLYVSERFGTIRIYDVERQLVPGETDQYQYVVTGEETVEIINTTTQNHNDDGSSHGTFVRQVTGIYVTGSALQPIMYVTSSDYREGAGDFGGDVNLDTNSGILHRLTWNGSQWEKIDLVRGLPRSEENHSLNGMALDLASNTLYIAAGGNSNAGAPSNNFAFHTEYAYAAAILSVDLDALDDLPVLNDGLTDYVLDLPTLDDPTRPNENGIEDPTDPQYNGIDENDPFGGNDGLNQAKIVPDSPVQIHSPGYRNAYDVIITTSAGRGGRMYTIDNGANGGWGGHPLGEADYPVDTNGPAGSAPGQCTHEYDPAEPGSDSIGPGNDPAVNNLNGMHYVRVLEPGDFNYVQPGEPYYAGHPAPVRGNPGTPAGPGDLDDGIHDPGGAGLYTHESGNNQGGLWRTQIVLDGNNEPIPSQSLPVDWPPVPPSLVYPAECDFRNSGETDGSLVDYGPSTNGLTEYDATNFNGALQGDILSAAFDGSIYRAILTQDGKTVTNGIEIFASNFASIPLDIIAQGNNDIFPGTVWAATYGSSSVTIFEPADYGGGEFECTGADLVDEDEDGDGYTNADELDNETNPCSGADKPPDHDGTFINGFLVSDLNDPDDDDDGIDDPDDYLQWDEDNGSTNPLPYLYELFNDEGEGFYELGFTGIMNDGTDYLDQVEKRADNPLFIPGGTAGLLTIPTEINSPFGATNNMRNGFQVGIPVSEATGTFTVRAAMQPPYATVAGQEAGVYIGPGNQSTFFSLTITPNGVRAYFENNDTAVSDNTYPVPGLASSIFTELFLTVDPVANTVQPKVRLSGGFVNDLGSPVAISGDLLAAVDGTYTLPTSQPSTLVMGTIHTSGPGGTSYAPTWDQVEVSIDPVITPGTWELIADGSTNGSPVARHESAFIMAGGKFYLMGGRETTDVDIFDPATNTWTKGAPIPIAPELMHNFQPVFMDGLIFVVNAYSGDCCGADEVGVPNVYIYDPVQDLWITGPEIPRQRGATGVVEYNDKLYVMGGLQGGHGDAGTQAFALFDSYDPYTNVWQVLPNMPRARDNFSAAVIGNKLYAGGGRNTGAGNGPLGVVIPEVDVFSFGSSTWSTLPSNIPTPRGSTGAAVLGKEVFILGGEVAGTTPAFNTVEALNVDTGTWRTGSANIAQMNVARHGFTATECNGTIWVAGGNATSGDGAPLVSIERYHPTSPTDCNAPAITPGTLNANSGDFGRVPIGVTDTKTITLQNTGGTQGIYVVNSTLTNNPTGEFTLVDPLNENIVIPPGGSVSVDVSYAPVDNGADTATLVFDTPQGGTPFTVELTGENQLPTLVRLNAGGPEVSFGGEVWVADTFFQGGFTFDAGDVSIIGTTKDDLYETERGGNFTYEIPVPEPGTYTVDLHFAETFWEEENARVFDIAIEGVQVKNDYDIFAEVGFNTATILTYSSEVTDGNMTITFTTETDNSKVSAIEVFTEAEVPGGELAASPPDLHFFTQPVGTTSAVQNVTVQNVGNQPLDVTGVTLTGVNAGDFDENFTTPVTLNAGGTLDIGVSFTPTDFGLRVATLEIAHTGTNASPVTVSITGEGANPGDPDSLIRINSGGPTISTSGLQWVADVHSISGDTFTYNPTAVAGTVDDELYLTERNAGFSGGFAYEIPVQQAGAYSVDLHFAEMFFTEDGQRIFDVTIEGVQVLDNYDIHADVGATTAAVKSYTGINVADGSLSIEFTTVANNAVVSAIQVFTEEPLQGGALGVSPSNVSFFDQNVGTTSMPRTITLQNTGDQAIDVTGVILTGGHAGDFAQNFEGPITLLPGGVDTFDVVFIPTEEGLRNAALEITHTGDNTNPVTVPLSGKGVTESTAATILYRVNAGGPEETDQLGTWEADTQAAPAPYLAAGGTQTYTDFQTVDVSHPSLPVGIPASLFKTERFDLDGGAQMLWQFSVPVGEQIEVRLFFAESFNQIDAPGQRIFDVSVEGSVPPEFDNIDPYADAGEFLYRGTMRQYTYTAADNVLDLEFLRDVQNPLVKAIEIRSLGEVPGNTPPQIAQAVGTITVLQDAEPSVVNLYDVFSDAEDADNVMTYTVENNSNPALVTPAINGSDLTLTYAPGGTGSASITVRATDTGTLFVEDTFTVNVSDASNTPPVIIVPIGNVQTTSGADPATFNLYNVFDDAEDADADLTLAVQSNTNAELVAPTISPSGMLTLTFSPNEIGTSTIVIRATDTGGLFVEETINLTILPSGPASARVEVLPGLGIGADTLGTQAFQVTNTSVGGQEITAVSIDLRTTIFPDMIFDPTGVTGGGGKCMVVDGTTGTDTAYQTPADPCVNPFKFPHPSLAGGYYVLQSQFDDFDFEDTFIFSADVDPATIVNTANPATADPVSGVELTGAVVTVKFNDNTTLSATLYREPGSDGGALAVLGTSPGPRLTISAPATGFVEDVNQVVTVNGPAGAQVSLLVVEARLHIEPSTNTGFEIEDFDANEALVVTEYSGTLNGSGTVNIPVTLTRTETPDGPDGGLNYIAAAISDTSGSFRATSPVSNALVLQVGPVMPPVIAPVSYTQPGDIEAQFAALGYDLLGYEPRFGGANLPG